MNGVMNTRTYPPFMPLSSAVDVKPDRRALAGWTLRRLYEGIFGGEFSPGQPLVEANLTELLGVSRQPIREALRELERDGLVVESKGNGQRTVVAFSREHIRELYGIRAALESVSFEFAATTITPQELAQLEAIQRQLEMNAGQRAKTHAPFDPTLDFRFHEIVCLSTGRRTLHAHLSTIWLQTWALLTQVDLAGTYPNTEEVGASYADRRQLIACLQDGDAQTAATVALDHVRNRRDQLLSAIDAGRGTFRLEESRALGQAAGVFA